MICFLCGMEHNGLVMHVALRHPELVKANQERLLSGENPGYLWCFCGNTYLGVAHLASHWSIRGGLENHLLEVRLG